MIEPMIPETLVIRLVRIERVEPVKYFYDCLQAAKCCQTIKEQRVRVATVQLCKKAQAILVDSGDDKQSNAKAAFDAFKLIQSSAGDDVRIFIESYIPPELLWLLRILQEKQTPGEK